ncbi:MAG: PEP-CTERM sorting domain-containing protein [Planctomycetaceae bacterium]|nr:PEP-CTERM sorting domain-containing protein [Planctomycetaceae bacterium]
MKHTALTILAVAAVLVLGNMAWGDMTTLINSPGSWTADGDWDNGAPQPDDAVRITAGTADVADGGNYSTGDVRINGGTATGVLNVNSGSKLTLTGGDALVISFDNPGDAQVNVDGSGSAITCNSTAWIGNGAGTNGKLSITGGAVVTLNGNVNHNSTVANSITLDSTSQLYINDWFNFYGGGVFNFDFVNSSKPESAKLGKIAMPYGVGSTLNYISGATVNMGAGSDGFGLDFLAMSNGVQGTLNITGAAVTIGGVYGGYIEGGGNAINVTQAAGQTTGITFEGAFTLLSGSSINLFFDNAPFTPTVFESGGYTMVGKIGDWGFRWAGSHLDELNTMLGDGRITVGFVPEPATMSLLALGGLAALIRRKK